MRQVALCAALCVALCSAGCATRSKAVTADMEGDYGKSARTWRTLAKQGDAQAQYRLAEMYVMGQGVVRDSDEAVRWFRAAAEQDHIQAQQKLGYMYLSGTADPEQDPGAEQWIIRLAELSSVDVRYKVGKAYLKGGPLPVDTTKAVEWFQAASDSLGDEKSVAPRLGDDGILREVAELGYVDAQFVLGKRYATGSGFPKSLTEAAK